MNVEVLVSTVNADIEQLIKKMNINSNAIIINQCERYEYEEKKINGNLIKIFHCNERGVGLSRNTALMRASGDIILFADDDEILIDDYENKIISTFQKNPKAEFIVFDINGVGNEQRKYKKIKVKKKLRLHNCLKYGAVRFAVKLDKIKNKNICFSLMFGGGTKYGSGEDSLFIVDAITNHINTWQVPVIIANVDLSCSSWFEGYTSKYYQDKGALFAAMKIKFNLIFLILITVKNHSKDKKNKLVWKLKQTIDGYAMFKKSN